MNEIKTIKKIKKNVITTIPMITAINFIIVISPKKLPKSNSFKPIKYMVKPIKKFKKNKSSSKTKKKKKAIDQEW